jgi:Na+-transporting NADH:ubiquinone oxidoreductase subunit C
MNTNSNAYTVIYTTLVVVVVAAVLAFTAMKLKPSQSANAKAETLRQMMSAAGIKSTDELYATKNADVLQLYAENIEQAYTIGLDGKENGTLSTDLKNIELVDNLKPQNKAIKENAEVTLPVYVFKSGVAVMPIYGAGLWGPIWGYVAFQPDHRTIAGAYFDHESETPGLGAKIKDEAWFREKFIGKTVEWGEAPAFKLEKNAEATGAANAVDAISGATMTSKGLNEALNVWFQAYENHFGVAAFFEALSEGEASDTNDLNEEEE